jgi:hypothetical protein
MPTLLKAQKHVIERLTEKEGDMRPSCRPVIAVDAEMDLNSVISVKPTGSGRCPVGRDGAESEDVSQESRFRVNVLGLHTKIDMKEAWHDYKVSMAHVEIRQ